MDNRKLIWTASAQKQLKEIYLFIAKDSIKQAEPIGQILFPQNQNTLKAY
ncbi:MAG TPA: type II toxin-antitoxin system RelE/ParE family toxin [Flavobacteriaceae bacterium]|nr:type II toxin-antitoxin system RelE/ParE family toxin [Flavobacteriaceae bacterium]